MASKKMKVGIVIPAYNEEKRIEKTLKEYSKYFDLLVKKDKFDYMLLVVINNTTDNTEAIVKQVAKKNKHIKYISLVMGGKGYAIIEGFKEMAKTNCELIGFIDADMATSPEAYYSLIKNIGNTEGIIASRYVYGAKVYPKQTIQRIVSSRIFNFLIRILFFMPYHDTQCGAKLFKRESIEKVLPDFTITKWAFDVDLLYQMRRNKFKVIEFPTIWSDKEYSTINFAKAGPRMSLAVIRLRILNSPFKRVMKIYDNLPEKLKIYREKN
jgi:glycosyltransferase involved in cell wall biosynthesis